jgi:hypothetical protein
MRPRPPCLTRQPARGPVEPNARSGRVSDRPEQVVDLVEPPFGRRKVALGALEDMLEHSHHVVPDERMANLAKRHPLLCAWMRRRCRGVPAPRR